MFQMFPGLYTVQYLTMYSSHSIHCKYSVKKPWKKRAISCMHGKITLRPRKLTLFGAPFPSIEGKLFCFCSRVLLLSKKNSCIACKGMS